MRKTPHLFLVATLFPFLIAAQQIHTFSVANSASDAELSTANAVDLISSDLELTGKDGSKTQTSYIRFENVTLPSDAIINSAHIVFYAKYASNTPTVLNIQGEIGNSAIYTTSAANFSGRSYASESVSWPTPSNVAASQAYSSPDIKSLMASMFPSGLNNANVGFKIAGNQLGDFTAYSYDGGGTTYRAKLVIDVFTLTGTTTVLVANSSNDAEQALSTGAVNLTSSDLELGGLEQGFLEWPTPNCKGIRFENVAIPATAQITDAYIEFYTMTATATGTTVVISGETGNAPVYTSTTNNITGRNYASPQVNWQTGAWTTVNAKNRTPNLKDIINQNRLAGWQSGQALAFKIEGNSTATAIAYSVNGSSTYQPRLVVEYLNNGGGEGAENNPANMGQLFINELAPQGSAAQPQDWIELYNGHNYPIFIDSGVYISNNSANPTLHEIKGVHVPANGYAIIIADGQNIPGHASFALNNSGGVVYLSRSVGSVITPQDEVSFGTVPNGESYGRLPNGTGPFTAFITPSYNNSNAAGQAKIDLVFSHLTGNYAAAFALAITAPAGAIVKYTSNGTTPSATVGTVYSGPISITESTVIKVYAYTANGNSGVLTHTYTLPAPIVPITTTVLVANGSNDAEQTLSSGAVNLTSSDLELGGLDGGTPQLAGVRFENVAIPATAQITDAYIEFYTKTATATGTSLIISGETGNAPVYTSATNNITGRNYASLQVNWQTGAWPTVNAKNRTPNLKNLINQNRLAGWQSGQSLAFKIQGNNTATAIAYSVNGSSTYQPRLVIEYLNNGVGPVVEGVERNPANMGQLYINELAGQGTPTQEEDWIELYNGHSYDLFIDSGVYISDKGGNRTLQEIKGVFVPSNGYAIIIADEQSIPGHANFDLKNTGETIYLSRLVNGVVTPQDEVSFGTVPFGESYGRLPNGTGAFTAFISPTYNSTNAAGLKKIDAVFSHPRGVYPSGFSLSIAVPAGTTVKYTTDGYFPSATVGTVYTAPLNITKNTVVKIYAYAADGSNSGVVAHSYILQNNLPNETGWEYKSNITSAEYAASVMQAPIVSISTESDLTSTYKRVSFEYIDNNVTPGASNFFSNSGGRRFGQESLWYTNSGIKFKFNDDFGVKKAAYPFFDALPGEAFEPSNKLNSIELKEGQDGPSRNVYGLGYMRYSEKISMNLQKQMGKYALSTKFVHYFLNGTYRGLKTMRDDFNQQNVEEYFGDDDDNYTKINLQDGYWTGGTVESGEGSSQVWATVKDLASAKNLQGFKQKVDLDDLIKFMLAYMMTDTENEAVAITHNNAPDYMKMRFTINDTDGSFFNASSFAGGGGNYRTKWGSSTSYSGPGGLFGKFIGTSSNPADGNLEFKTLVKDQVLKQIGPAGGTWAGASGAPLSVSNIQNLMIKTVGELDTLYKMDAAYMAYENSPANDVYQRWKNEEHPRILGETPARVRYNLEKWLAFGLAHTLAAVTVDATGEISNTTPVTITNPNATAQVYYTLNGTDPMGNDGVVSSEAILYTAGFVLPNGSYNIVTRAFTTNNWGPKTEKAITVTDPAVGKFVITGINYKPLSNSDAEFLLITNTGNAPLDLSGYAVADAITYTFPASTTLAAGETIMLAKNLTLVTGFEGIAKYQWTSGSLNNSGEPISFTNAGNLVDNVTYGPASPWPVLANGQGYYLRLINNTLDNSMPESWEAAPLTPQAPLMVASPASLPAAISGAAELKKDSFQVYPNPALATLNINTGNNILKGNGTILYIYSLQGTVVQEKKLKPGNNTINLAGLKPGTYILKATGADGKPFTYKVVKI